MPETGVPAAIPATGELHPDAVRSEVGRAMTDAAHPQHASYEQTKYGNRADWDRWTDGLYRRLPGAAAPVLASQKTGAVEIGAGIEVRGAAPGLGVTPKPDGSRPGAAPPASEPAGAESSAPDLAALAERYPDLHREWGGDFQARMDTAAEAVGRLEETIVSATGEAAGGEMLLELARDAGFSDAQILRFLSGR